MSERRPDDPSCLVVGGLVDDPRSYGAEHLLGLGESRDPAREELVVPLRPLIEQAAPSVSATHVSAVSADGAYTASIPLAEALAKGELHVGRATGGWAPVRLEVPGGMTKCWNVKGLGLLRVTAGPEPDSLPDVLTH